MSNEVIKNAKFHHVAISSFCFDESVEFYEKLGFKKVSSWGEGEKRGILMDIGDGGFFEIFANGSERPETDPKYVHLAIGTTDTDTAYKAAVAAGGKPKIEPYDHVIPAKPEPIKVRLAFLWGPSGELIEFFAYRD